METRTSGSKWRTTLDVVATVAIVCASAGLVWRVFWSSPAPTARRGPSVPTSPLSLDGVPIEGDVNAPVVIIEYSDFECPFCGKFAREILPALRSDYVGRGKARIAFRQFPIKGHRNAERAAEAALCAEAQGRFWLLHDSLFARPQLEGADLGQMVKSAGVDIAGFEACMSRAPQQIVSRDVDSGKALGVFGTPTFFIGRDVGGAVAVKQVIMGARPLEEFKAAVETLLAGSK